GWENPLGKEFSAGDDKSNYKVIGVVNDFHFYSLKQKIEPLIMWINQERCNFIVAKINAHDISSTLAFMENIWNTHLPDRPFEASFLDEHFKIVYQNDQNLKNLFAMFSFFAIFVGCLGLFGLASFTVEQKTKEIGIRKVMGASIAGIVMLLSKEFAKWVAIASLIGFPIAYFSMQNWLSNFVYRTSIHFYTFIVAAFIVILIALFTISFQTIKAAVANPVKALKYE
ncbi:MAG: FtsX-like permease family protein, partial [Calditrichia bacterium]|nr:FtsX-like permease family protein [Calditrichia bacterium]